MDLQQDLAGALPPIGSGPAMTFGLTVLVIEFVVSAEHVLMPENHPRARQKNDPELAYKPRRVGPLQIGKVGPLQIGSPRRAQGVTARCHPRDLELAGTDR